MAQHKYDLITVRTSTEGPQRHHPWYKERLRLKFLDTSKPSSTLESGKWTFISNGIDDFRSGKPTVTSGQSMLRRGKVNPVPLIDSKSSELLEKKQAGSLRVSHKNKIANNPGWRTLYHKLGPQKQMQQEHVDELVSRLLKHPLGLYPHLEESIPPEMLEDVVDILDPELKSSLDQAEGYETSNTPSLAEDPIAEEEDESMFDQEEEEEEAEVKERGAETDKSLQTAVYKFPLKKTSEEKEHEESLLATHQVISATQQSRVNQVTHDLVQWVEDLGDSGEDQYAIDETTIKSLFGSDYETKPVLTAPIHVVELLNVPAELRLESRQRSTSAFSSSRPTTSDYRYRGYDRLGRRGGSLAAPWMEAEPRHVRTKYGVWYLPVSLWKPRPADEPLRDPQKEAAEAENEELMKRLTMDKKLSVLHGARAFKEFVLVNKKGAPVPKFLKNVNMNASSEHNRRLQSSVAN